MLRSNTNPVQRSSSLQQPCFPSPYHLNLPPFHCDERHPSLTSVRRHNRSAITLHQPSTSPLKTTNSCSMASYHTSFPNGLNLFTVLPDHLIERLLYRTGLNAKDLAALRCAAQIEKVYPVAAATEAAAAVLVHAHHNGAALVRNKLPSETWISLLMFLQRLDGAARSSGATEVWTAGRNEFGQGARPGHTDENALIQSCRMASDAHEFESPPARIIVVKAGAHHSLAVSELGALHVAGANHRGQLGLGDMSLRSTWTPVLDLKWARVAQVACGSGHTAVLTGEGFVLVTGANDFGQLGLGDRTQRLRFTKADLPPARMISTGNAHTVVLLEDGTVYASGDNSRGQLGGRRDRGRDKFAPIGCFGRKVVRVACGSDTTMLLTVDNMILVTGKRHCGLSVIGGLGMSRVTHLSVGEGFAVASTDESEVAVSVHRKRFQVTDELLHISASCVSAGFSHYAIATDDGCVFATGTNTFGQVAAGEMGLTIEGSQNARVVRPHRVPLSRVEVPRGYRALCVAAGMFHTLFLLEKEEPYV